MDVYGSPYSANPLKAAAEEGAVGCDTVGWAGVIAGASHAGSGDGDGGNLMWVIGTPCCEVTEAGGGGGRGGKCAAGGGAEKTGPGCAGAVNSWRNVRRFETAQVRSRTAVEISCCVRMGAGSEGGADWPPVAGPEVAGGDAVEVGAPEVAIAAEAVGNPEDIEPELADTKLVETRCLPGRGRRL